MSTKSFRLHFSMLRVFLVMASFASVVCAPRLHGQALVVSNLWSIPTSEGRSYVSATANERGVAYNPLLNYAYIVSRNGPLRIARVDAETGVDLGVMDTNGIAGGTFFLSQIGVADDGMIYGANLTTGSGGTGANAAFKLYRWPDDGSGPTMIYNGNPLPGGNLRLGDTFDVRGSGINTEIIAAANATNIVVVFRPTDASLDTFAPSPILVTGAALNEFGKGLTFGPTNTFFGKNSGSATLRLCRYDYNTGVGASLRTYSILSSVAAIDYDPTRDLIGGVQTASGASGPHAVVLYDLSSGAANLVYSNAFPAPITANANVVGGINILSNRMISVATANGVQMTIVEDSNEAVPPSFSTSPGNITIVQGGYSSYNVTASGSKPITYQWFKDSNTLTNETNTTLILTNVTPDTAGSYYVQAFNYAGSAYSSTGTVTITPAVLSSVARQLWRIQPGDAAYPFIASDSLSRGMAYNPANHTLIVCSRTGGNGLHVLDAETGTLLRQMSFNGSGGTFAINMVGCADDGRVFACNLTTDGTTTPFKIYLWPSDAAGVNPTEIYAGDPGNGSHDRWGDNFDVQGGSLEIQDIRILAASRNGRLAFLIRDVGLLTYDDRLLINVPDVNPGSFGLSVALAEENSFWGKANGSTNYLVKVSYDPVTGAGTPIRFITNSVLSVVGYSVTNQWIGAISLETPDNVRLYDVATTPARPIDTEISPTDNANANGTGSVKFGFERMFVLESNNGVAAFRLAPVLHKSYSGNTLTLVWAGNHTLQASGTVDSGYTNVTTTSGHSVNVSATGTTFFRLLE
jgi:hypothetical protein